MPVRIATEHAGLVVRQVAKVTKATVNSSDLSGWCFSCTDAEVEPRPATQCLHYAGTSCLTCLQNRAQIYYLNKATQPELQRHINGLPALFLDCDDDIDLEHDTGAKARYAQQISEFSTFVRQLQARRCAPLALDLGHDTGAKARYAQQISEFSTFVRQLQARRCAPLGQGSAVSLAAANGGALTGVHGSPFITAAAFAYPIGYILVFSNAASGMAF